MSQTTPFATYLRILKLAIEDAGRNLSRKEYEVLKAIAMKMTCENCGFERAVYRPGDNPGKCICGRNDAWRLAESISSPASPPEPSQRLLGASESCGCGALPPCPFCPGEV